MTILLVAHTKGGVGKSTVAVNLAVMRAASGRDVLLVDCDRGQSTAAFAGVRLQAGLKPAITCVSIFGEAVHQQLLALSEKYADIVVDAGGEGQGAPEVRLALSVADRVLTPCRPPAVDTQRLAKIHGLINEIRITNPKLEAMLVPTQASTHPSVSDVSDFYKRIAAADYHQFRVLDAVIRRRDAFMEWMDTGEVVTEQKQKDPKAIAEMQQLYAEVFHD
jgi:chromosome partitioning protein